LATTTITFQGFGGSGKWRPRTAHKTWLQCGGEIDVRVANINTVPCGEPKKGKSPLFVVNIKVALAVEEYRHFALAMKKEWGLRLVLLLIQVMWAGTWGRIRIKASLFSSTKLS
jgi:hypothetical protein